jgi:hypothetical protein
VVADIAKKKTVATAMDDKPEIATGPNGPEILVSCTVQLVKLHPWIRRV